MDFPLFHKDGTIPDNSAQPYYRVKDDEQRYFQGISADYLKEVSKLTGIAFKTTFYSDRDIRAAIGALETGKVDLMPTFVGNPLRPPSFQISAPYFQTLIVVVMRSDAAPLREASQLNSMTVAGLLTVPPKLRALGWNIRIHFANSTEGLRGVAEGRFDAFLGERAVIVEEFKTAPVRNIKIAARLPVLSVFCLGVSKFPSESPWLAELMAHPTTISIGGPMPVCIRLRGREETNVCYRRPKVREMPRSCPVMDSV